MQRRSKVETFKVGVHDHRIAPSRPPRPALTDMGAAPTAPEMRGRGGCPHGSSPEPNVRLKTGPKCRYGANFSSQYEYPVPGEHFRSDIYHCRSCDGNRGSNPLVVFH